MTHVAVQVTGGGGSVMTLMGCYIDSIHLSLVCLAMLIDQNLSSPPPAPAGSCGPDHQSWGATVASGWGGFKEQLDICV